MYGHAERVRLATQLSIAETIELLLSLPSLNEEQLQFVQEFAPERLGLRNRALPERSAAVTRSARRARYATTPRAVP
jgi:hypothetical protein